METMTNNTYHNVPECAKNIFQILSCFGALSAFLVVLETSRESPDGRNAS